MFLVFDHDSQSCLVSCFKKRKRKHDVRFIYCRWGVYWSEDIFPHKWLIDLLSISPALSCKFCIYSAAFKWYNAIFPRTAAIWLLWTFRDLCISDARSNVASNLTFSTVWKSNFSCIFRTEVTKFNYFMQFQCFCSEQFCNWRQWLLLKGDLIDLWQ